VDPQDEGLEMIKQAIANDGLNADLFSARTAESKKAIIMLGGSEGGKSWSRIKKPIEILVEKGYVVLSLAYIKAQGLPKALEEIPLEYFESVFDWLSLQKGIVPNEYAIIGGSKGAEAALVLASIYPQVKAVIAFSPSSVVWQGIPSKRFEIGKDVKSSWSYKGAGLPFLAYPPSTRKMDLLFLRLRKMHEAALEDKPAAHNAAIHVEKIRGALLLISGERDGMWPATKMSQAIIERLEANGFEYNYEHLSLDTGHNGIIMKRGCWRKTFAFLEEHFA